MSILRASDDYPAPTAQFARAPEHAWNPGSQTGSPYCNGTFKTYADPNSHPETWCQRALPFVRSRYGSSDYARSKRQQLFVDAAIDAVDSDELSDLVSTAMGEAPGAWQTNFPITLGNATDLYNALLGASLVNKVVFSPKVYASRISGTRGYQLKLSAVRGWCDTYMS